MAISLLLAACSDGGKGVTPPAESGVLTVRLAAADQNAGAIVLSVTGPGEMTDVAAAAGSSYVVHSRMNAGTLRVAVFGALDSGPVLQFRVPDVSRASSYRATVLEIADRDNALRSSSAGYTAAVER